jgi:two-component system chemotaxis sensor kinase CheA
MSDDTERYLNTLGDITSELMMIDDPGDDAWDSIEGGLDELYSSFEVLQTIEDSPQVQSIMERVKTCLSMVQDVQTDPPDDIEDLTGALSDELQQLESDIRDYGQGVGDDTESSEGDSSDEPEEPPTESKDLEEKDYDKLQEMAKERDIKANQSTEELIEAIKSHDEQAETAGTEEEQDGETKDTESEPETDDASSEVSVPDEIVTDPDDYDEDLFYDFFTEASDHLENFEDILLQLEDQRDPEALNEGFRGMHSIKGAAGFLNLSMVNRISHAMEDLLGLYRDDGYRIEEDHIDLLFSAMDCLKRLVNTHHSTVEDGQTLEIDTNECERMLVQLRDTITEVEQTGEKVSDTEQEASEEAPEAEEDVELKETQSIRVDTEKIDNLINRAGELVTTFHQLKGGQDEGGAESSRENRKIMNQLDRIVGEIQESSLSLRMVPLSGTFNKMKRMVRELSKEFDKKVDLEITGDDTELDRSLVEKIQDPIVHLVRNAMDHGIESPEERVEKDKPETGTLELKAYHESGDVVIEISDDGAGIDPDAIFEKAVDKELVEPDEEMSEDEIYMLLFEPGFSTTEEVTDVSGRGVGMDVVRKNVESIRGSVEVDSGIDEGTTFRLKIPLTLSIISGMIMKLGEQRFVIPTTNIVRSLKPDEEQVTTVEGRGEVLNLRGDLISLCRLNQLFDLDVEDRPFTESLIVIVKGGGEKVGLQVDDILGQQEVVIKSLGLAFEELKGISGAAILGDGSVGLILDTPTLGDVT